MDNKNILFVSDLDGTLLNHKAEVSNYTKNAINYLIESGLNFSVATARPLKPVLKMLSGMNISVPIILLNGVLIYDTQEKKYKKINIIEKETINNIFGVLKNYNISYFLYSMNETYELQMFHNFSKNTIVPKYITDRALKYDSQQIFDDFSNINFNSIIYFTLIDTYENLLDIFNYLSKAEDLKLEFYKNVYNPDFWFLEIFDKKSSKKNAVEFLKKEYKFNFVVGFGDNNNDIPLFEVCDIKVAVDNATPLLKNKADYICDSNDNDGVSKWIENNMKKHVLPPQ